MYKNIKIDDYAFKQMEDKTYEELLVEYSCFEEEVECYDCQGTGDDGIGDYYSCPICKGQGIIKIERYDDCYEEDDEAM